MYREQYGEEAFGCLGIKGRYCDVGAYLSGKMEMSLIYFLIAMLVFLVL